MCKIIHSACSLGVDMGVLEQSCSLGVAMGSFGEIITMSSRVLCRMQMQNRPL